MNDTDESKQIDELCQRIYKNHRKAFDLIRDRVGTPASAVLAEVRKVLEEDNRWTASTRWSSGVFFVPKGWLEWLPQFGLTDDRWWIYVAINSSDGRLECGVELAPFADLTKRREIAKKLLEACPGFGFKPPRAAEKKEVKNNYSRITATERVMEWNEDEEPEPNAIRERVMKALDELYPKLEKLALVLKPLCQSPASRT